MKPVSKDGKVTISLFTEALNGEIYYTTDGTAPATQSIKYTNPITIDSTVTIKAVTVVNGNIMGYVPAQQSFVMHKAIGRNVMYTNLSSTYYPAEGPNSLTDGVRGTTAVGKYWHGFSGKDLIATIDLGIEKTVHKIVLGCLQNYSDWIFLPNTVKFEISTDGQNFKEVKTVENPV